MVNDTEELSAGSVLRDYQIHSTLGCGGFGVVYEGQHTELGIYVAIKEYYPSELSVRRNGKIQPRNPEFAPHFEEGLDRFLQEAQQLEKFRDCPNIVTCREFFRAGGTAYMVLEYVSGISLSQLLKQREDAGNPFTEQELLLIILPLLDALQTIHESGVYHRDIKPSNIMMRRDDQSPILIDFGAVKHEISKHTKSFAPFTDGYAAMEQIAQEDIGPWTDLYGVGAVMWRMVAGGNPPFIPANPVSSQKRSFKVMGGHEDPLPSAREIGKGRFSERILHTIDGCLTINVKDRVQNCRELRQRLTSSSPLQKEKQLPQSVVIPNSSQATQPNKKRKILALTIAATCLFLVLIGNFLWKTPQQSSVQEAVSSSQPCIDVNLATYSELREVHGIGHVKALAVIEYRNYNAPFTSLDELDNVRGIGPATIANFRSENFCVQN